MPCLSSGQHRSSCCRAMCMCLSVTQALQDSPMVLRCAGWRLSEGAKRIRTAECWPAGEVGHAESQGHPPISTANPHSGEHFSRAIFHAGCLFLHCRSQGSALHIRQLQVKLGQLHLLHRTVRQLSGEDVPDLIMSEHYL